MSKLRKGWLLGGKEKLKNTDFSDETDFSLPHIRFIREIRVLMLRELVTRILQEV